MKIINIHAGSWLSNCYVLISVDSHGKSHAAVIDPSAPADDVISMLAEHGATLEMIIMTHGHFDHIMSLDSLREKTNATVCIHKDDAEMLCDGKKNAYSFFFGASFEQGEADRLLADGDIESANTALGAPYFITGGVCHGRGVGKKLGFPTLNLPYPPGRVKLKQGVYRCAVLARDEIYNAVTNVGVCPTFDLKESVIEAHLIDFSGDLYGREVKIYFLGYLREERKFDSPEALTEQIATDTKRTIEEHGEKTWQDFGLN